MNHPPRLYVGVDPGAGGGVAMIQGEDVSLISLRNWGPLQIWGIFHPCLRVLEEGNPPFVVLEKVGGYVRGGAGNIGSAMFNFGRSYGWLEMSLCVAGLLPGHGRIVAPATWQRGLDILPRKADGPGAESKAQFKRRLLARAKGMYPSAKVTLATADALLLAEYARRIGEGLL